MKITVDKNRSSDGDLTFTITVKELHEVPFTAQEYLAMEGLDKFINQMQGILDINSKVYEEIKLSNYALKDKLFQKMLNSLRFSIQEEFRPKFQPICQEIYNEIYDKQTGFVKSWMETFDPQRTTYYFDNDSRMQDNKISTDLMPVDKLDEDDEDEDED